MESRYKRTKTKKTLNPNKTLKPSPKPTQIPTLKPTQKRTQKNVKTRTTQCPHTMVVLILATRIILQFLIQFKFYIQGINYAIQIHCLRRIGCCILMHLSVVCLRDCVTRSIFALFQDVEVLKSITNTARYYVQYVDQVGS